MPGCVARGKDRAIDSIWPDIREEILWEVAAKIDGKTIDEDDPQWLGVDCFRAFWRYHLFPYNKGIWGQLRDPVVLIFRLITLTPVYGVSQLCFLFIFCIIDKTDEFQLINFILGFKGTQFISMGLIRCVTGFGLFMMCLTAKADGPNNCYEKGPGVQAGSLFVCLGFFLQLVLVWTCFLLLRCAKEKGRTVIKDNVEHDQTGMASVSGGYISYFLWYDLLFFCIALIIPAYAVSSRGGEKVGKDDWVVAQSVFAAQVVYGLLSAPFFVFTLPGLARVLTHAMPTAYDTKGRCRKPVKPPAPETPKAEEDELISQADAEGVFQNLRDEMTRAMMGGRERSD